MVGPSHSPPQTCHNVTNANSRRERNDEFDDGGFRDAVGRFRRLSQPRLDSSPAAILHWRISLQHDSLLLAPLLCLKMLK